MLTHHNSTVNCMQFTNNHSHIISGSADGVLAIVRVGNWQLEKLWEKAHNGKAILDIAIHASGKLALTLGADSSLRTWNLLKGRQAYIINLNSKSKDAKSLERIIWAEDEVRFILYGGKCTEVWSIDTGGVLKIIEHSSKVCSCLWYNDKEIIVGYENGQIARVNIETDSKNFHDAHDTRIKALSKYKKWIVSASSSGEIKVWNKHFEQQAIANASCRVTCMLITKILTAKKEETDKAIEFKEEVAVKSTPKGSFVVVEYEDDNLSKKRKKNNKIDNKQSHTTGVNDSHKKKKKGTEDFNNKFDEEIQVEGNKKKKKHQIEDTMDEKLIPYFEQETLPPTKKKKKKKKIDNT